MGSRRGDRAAYAACAWALVFAAINAYWGLGGTVGLGTLGPAIAELARDPWFVALGVWGVGVLKVLAGLLALALVRPWGRRLPRRLLLVAAWGLGAGMSLYGGALLVQHGLMLAGVIRIPAGLGWTATVWHIVLWDPWWLLGGVAFAVAARRFRRASRGPSRGADGR